MGDTTSGKTTAAADPFAWYEEQKATLATYARQQKPNVETSPSPADTEASPDAVTFYMDKAPIPSRFGRITEVTFSKSKTDKSEQRTVRYGYALSFSSTQCLIAETYSVYADGSAPDPVLGISCKNTETGKAVSASTSSAAVYLDQIHAAIEGMKIEP